MAPPRGIHLIQAGSHARLISPMPMKTGRQPYFAIRRPAPKVPTAGPNLTAPLEYAIGEASVMLRQMEAEDFRAGGNHHRLADAKHQPHRQQHRESSYDTGCRSSKRPEQEPGCYHPVGVQPVHQPAADKLHRGVGPKKCGEQNAQLCDRNAQLVFQKRGSNREIAAVNVVDESTNSQQDKRRRKRP